LSESKILLGFEISSSQPICIRLTHTVVTGMTQSGKTTTLEAIIHRSRIRAIAFKIKRGEAGFHNYRIIPPYFKAGSGWQYVESLVNVSLGEKVKYEPGMRGAIMRVAQGGFKSLRVLLEKAERLANDAKREFQRDLYTKLTEYLKLVVPELERHNFSDKIEILEGVNVMDLSDMKVETQSLVIASVLEYASKKLDNIIVVIPEAWEHIPQGRMTPVKLIAASYIRKGAAIGNYLIIDSQDIAGIDKEPLRQCDNWILGRQKDKREVDRTLEEIFKNRPSPEEVMTLPRGVFYACLGNEVYKVYVMPSWMEEETAKAIALGKLTVENVEKPKVMEEEQMWKEKYEELKGEKEKIESELRNLKRLNNVSQNYKDTIKSLTETVKRFEEENKKLGEDLKTADEETEKLRKELQGFREFKDALAKIIPLPAEIAASPRSVVPSEVSVTTEQPTISVQVQRKPLSVTDKDLLGKVAIVYADGELGEEWFTVSNVTKSFEKHAWPRDPRTSAVLDDLVHWGFLEKRYSGKRPDYKVKIKPEDAKIKRLLKVEETT